MAGLLTITSTTHSSERTDLMPGSFLIVEDCWQLLRDFSAALSLGQVPAGRSARNAGYDPLRPRPLADSAAYVEKLLGVATDIPMDWRFGEYLAANTSNLLTARALSSKNIGEGLEILHQNQTILTNSRTISHKSCGDGNLAAIHRSESLHDPVTRFIFNSFLAAKLSHVLDTCTRSNWQHQLDRRAACFGSLMQRLDRELDFVEIEFRSNEVTLEFSRDALNCKMLDMDDRLKLTLDHELNRKRAEMPETGMWRDRIKFHISSNHLRDISLDDICDTFRVQRRTLGRLLRDEGTTFTNILTELRREKALHLVRHTGVPLKRVAAELGFNSDASFSMAFKSWTGMTPKGFRTTNLEALRAKDDRPATAPLASRAAHFAGPLLARWTATPASARISAARPSA